MSSLRAIRAIVFAAPVLALVVIALLVISKKADSREVTMTSKVICDRTDAALNALKERALKLRGFAVTARGELVQLFTGPTGWVVLRTRKSDISCYSAIGVTQWTEVAQ